MTETKTPETKSYRVVCVGAIYQKADQALGSDGELRNVSSPVLATRGDVIDLVPYEAKRLSDLGAVKPADADLSYDEMSDVELEQETTARSLDVHGSAADGSIRREDRINALTIHDQGAPVVDPAGTDVASLAEHLKSQRLNVDDTVALAGDDPAKARTVLEAEHVATGGSPRSGVEQGLQKIIDG